MKSLNVLALVAASIGLAIGSAMALPVDLSIPAGGGLGPTSDSGNAVHWIELTTADFGKGLALPIRLSFDSGRKTDLTDLGTGLWRCPIVQSRALQRDDKSWLVELPCGKRMKLEPAAGKDGEFKTPDGEWLGHVKNKSFIVSREDGWELEFGARGYLVRLRDDHERNILWNRDDRSRLLSVTEASTKDHHAPLVGLSVKRNEQGKITALSVRTAFGTVDHELGYNATNQITSVGFYGHREPELLNYRLSEQGQPEMGIVGGDLVEKVLSWDKGSLKLLSDGVWTYKIEPVDGVAYPRISRTGPTGELESFLDDKKGSGEERFTSADGTTTIRKMATDGPAKGKLESISRILAGHTAVITVYQATYDDNGMIATEIDALGRVTKHEHSLWGASSHSGIKLHIKIDPLGAKIIESYDRHGNLLSLTDALGAKTIFTYDEQNRRVKTIGPDGVVVEALTYNPQGKIESRTDAMGATSHFGYDKNGNLTTTTNALGYVTKDDFDARGNRIASTDALGNTCRYEYNLGNQLIKTFAPPSRSETSSQSQGTLIETITYNTQGKIASITDAEGNVQRTQYDKFGRITSRTDPLDRTTRYSYDVTKGATGCASCNASSMPTLITMPSGRKIHRVYDADKHLIQETTAFGSIAPATTKHEYDIVGNEIRMTDPLGRCTQYQYDAGNRRIGIIFPDGTRRSYAYDPSGQIVTLNDELGHTVKLVRDVFGNVVTQTNPSGYVTTNLYETPGSAALHRSTGTKSAAGVVKRIEYDAIGQRVALGTESADTKKRTVLWHEFDAAGNEIKTVHPGGKTLIHSYDERNRRVSTTDNLGRVWKYAYPASTSNVGAPPCCGADPISNARAFETTHPDGTKELRITDAAGQVVETKDSKGESVTYGYDPDGRLTTLTDANGHVTRWTYDPSGKLESKVYPDKTTELYEHDLAGQLITRTRPDGNVALNTYDARGRLISTCWKDDKAERSEYKYDATGHLIWAKNLSATIERSYTPGGKIARETQLITAEFASNKIGDASRYDVGYEYDADGRVAKITYPEGTTVGYAYNDRGELAGVTEVQPGSRNPKTETVASYKRNPDGQVTELKLANGTTTTKHYDLVGRLSEIAHIGKDGSILFAEANRYDERDRRTARIKGDGTVDLFSYDPAGQVTAAAYGQAWDQSKPLQLLTDPNAAQNKTESPEQGITNVPPQQTFAYDPVGNRKQFQDVDGIQVEYQTNAANQYTALVESNPARPLNPVQNEPDYDPNGNLLKDPYNTYTWDADIHLLSVTTKKIEPKTRTSKLETTSFRYDPLHRRVARLEDNGSLTHFIHDGWNVITEFTSHRRPVAPYLSLRLTWGEDISLMPQGAGGIGGLLKSVRLDRETMRATACGFHYDGSGNVVLLTSADGSISARYTYDVFGKTIDSRGEAAETNRYRFSTKPIESNGELAFYGFRYYSPRLGRWTARDPNHEKGGINLYGMVNNDPINMYDAQGKNPAAIVGACCVVIGAIYVIYQACQDTACMEAAAKFRNDCASSEYAAKAVCELFLGGTYVPGANRGFTCRSYGYTVPCGDGTCQYSSPTSP